jgi:hypothetical protein
MQHDAQQVQSLGFPGLRHHHLLAEILRSREVALLTQPLGLFQHLRNGRPAALRLRLRSRPQAHAGT